jgi:uncharacterized repeat protein (TIGR01451 family)
MKHLLLGLSALALAAPAFADVRLSSTVQEEIVIRKPNGGQDVKLVAADSVAPGDTVIVRIAYANESDKPASDIVISNPVPEHLSLVDIREGGEPAYSVDGGKTWGPLGALKIVSGGETRAANVADVTNVRWRLTHPLAPGAAGSVAFAARLN